MTTPAMTAQDALATLTAFAKWTATQEWSEAIELPPAIEAIRQTLSDAERRATEAEAMTYKVAANANRLNDERNDLQSRLSAVEARCGNLEMELRIVASVPVPESVEKNTLGWLKARARIVLTESDTNPSILAYPGGKSDKGETAADIDEVIGNAFAAATIVEPLSRSGDSALVEAVGLLREARYWLPSSTHYGVDASVENAMAEIDKFIQQHGERK